MKEIGKLAEDLDLKIGIELHGGFLCHTPYTMLKLRKETSRNIVLHSAHMSKIFMKLMGTSCDLKWRLANKKERLWVLDPSHPIMEGLGEFIELVQEEMYGEFFDVPTPDELLMMSWFEGGEVFRSAMTYKRGKGKIFYFRPGHETYPSYYNPQI